MHTSFACRKKLCKDKNWIKYGEDSSIYSNNETTMTTNPASSILNFIKSNLKTCRWKEIYIRAYLLNQNWNKGRYTAIHMLRGHNQRVVSLSCDGKKCIYYTINYCNITT